MPQTASEYHHQTSYDRQRLSGHHLDWANQPDVFKQYAEIPGRPLPAPQGYARRSLWELTAQPAATSPSNRSDNQLTSQLWARILMLANGLSAQSHISGGVYYYRTAASAGALYPNELYLATFTKTDLPVGVYHFQSKEMLLTPLRRENLRAMLQETSLPAEPLATVFITGIFFRSAWKYRDRAWRYILLDAGHILQNLLLALEAEGLRGAVAYDFDDLTLARWLGIDVTRESVLVSITIYAQTASFPAAASFTKSDAPSVALLPELPPSLAAASRVSAGEIRYEGLQEAVTASQIRYPNAVHLPPPDMRIGVRPIFWQPLAAAPPTPDELNYAQAILHRRSRRNFIPAPLDHSRFSRLIQLICNGARCAQTPAPAGTFPIALGYLANHIANTPNGFYLLDTIGQQIGMSAPNAPNDWIPAMTDICFGQSWLKHANLHLVCLTHLPDLDHFQGPRGYRYAMLSAGRMGQLLYLGARALNLGCCGIGAFYDDEARELLGLSRGSVMLYLIAAGVVKRL